MATSVDDAQKQDTRDMDNAMQQNFTVTISSKVRAAVESRQETQRQQSEMLTYYTDGSLQPLHLRNDTESTSQPEIVARHYHDHTESRTGGTSELVTGITITLSTTNRRSFVQQETNPLCSGVMLCGYLKVEVHR